MDLLQGSIATLRFCAVLVTDYQDAGSKRFRIMPSGSAAQIYHGSRINCKGGVDEKNDNGS